MTLNDDSQPDAPKRRRGAALEAALLDAAWEELLEKGYDRFTIDSVADRAHTSRAVVYRRWPGKPELVQAAAIHIGTPRDRPIPDTGSLRGDVLELINGANDSRARIGVQMFMQLGGYFAETGTGLSDLRHAFLSNQGRSAMEPILERAIARGEVDEAKLTPRVLSVPFDLYRQELMLTLRVVPEDVIESIVDEVFLPLVRAE
jgi:AcrR family transcriptional regulator